MNAVAHSPSNSVVALLARLGRVAGRVPRGGGVRAHRGVDCPGADGSAVPIDGLDADLALCDREVIEAILVVLPAEHVHFVLGRDATTTARDEAGHTAKTIWVPIHHLEVHVAGDHQVQAVFQVELTIEIRVVAAGEVRDKDLPISSGVPQLLRDPSGPIVPELLEPGVAAIHAGHAAHRGATRILRVVLCATDVVLRVGADVFQGVDDVRVGHEDVDREILVGILNVLHPVRCREDPPVARPRVGDLLVPSGRELAAAPVVIAQDSEPGLAVQTRAGIDVLKDPLELCLSDVINSCHGRFAALPVHAAPIEVVANIQYVFGVAGPSPLLHLRCDKVLGWHVNVLVPAARCLAALLACDVLQTCAQLALCAKAVGHLGRRTNQEVVLGICPVPAHGMRPRRLATRILDDLRVVRQLPCEAPPVAHSEEVGDLGAPDCHRRPSDAVVLEGQRGRWHAAHLPRQHGVRVAGCWLDTAGHLAPAESLLVEPVLELLEARGGGEPIVVAGGLPNAALHGPPDIDVAHGIPRRCRMAVGILSDDVPRLQRLWRRRGFRNRGRWCHRRRRGL
mmetsp:Transcript_125672/g.350057  ORF Transcript_125672/g.350057 Transcript_125672/m.350057 type:complete len:566 (+) Transcript_125672:344-2041(+)